LLTIQLHQTDNTLPAAPTEGRILAAASKVFQQRGFDGARMQEIADEAGINKALLHYYFRSKDLLFERVFRASAAEFFSSLLTVLRSEEPLREKVVRLCDLYITVGLEHPYISVFIITEANRTGAGFVTRILSEEGVLPDFEPFRRQIAEEVSAGRTRPITAEQLMMDILGLCLFPVIARPMMQRRVVLKGAGMADITRELAVISVYAVLTNALAILSYHKRS
jgi:TetR/AcrR family transcriptional regulator